MKRDLKQLVNDFETSEHKFTDIELETLLDYYKYLKANSDILPTKYDLFKSAIRTSLDTLENYKANRYDAPKTTATHAA